MKRTPLFLVLLDDHPITPRDATGILLTHINARIEASLLREGDLSKLRRFELKPGLAVFGGRIATRTRGRPQAHEKTPIERVEGVARGQSLAVEFLTMVGEESRSITLSRRYRTERPQVKRPVERSAEIEGDPGMILGIDIGTSSIGWSLLATDSDGTPIGIVDAGARIFPAGVDGDIESGREEPRNLKRREARSSRRLNWRESRRHRRCISLLQSMGLLPPTDDLKPPTLDRMFAELDAEWRPSAIDHRETITWLYRLRARGLDERLEPYELGRAIIHLLKRRGFKSNRKEQANADEETGQVKEAIRDLAHAMEAASHRTVGEHFASLDPEDQRIRSRWLGRSAIEDEFDAILTAQAAHHDCLQTERATELRQAAFHQRPLKPVKPGRCSLERGLYRARMASLSAQRFRLLQDVVNLQVLNDGPPRPLSDDERTTLVAALEETPKLTWAGTRKVLGFPKTVTFNLQEGGKTHLIGNRSASALREAFKADWNDLASEDREQAVEDLLTFEKTDALRRRARKHWKLDPESADLFTSIQLEPGYANHSEEAMERLIPDLEQGVHYSTARKRRYPDSFSAEEPVDMLPAVKDFDAELRNPTVSRCLSELRKVVNAIVARHGKPERIRVELGRDLKRGRADRQRMTRENNQRSKDRDETRNAIRTEAGIAHPKRDDITKVRLADECNWVCPFTGRSFGWLDLFGPNPSMDVEHIIPFSQSLDDSYLNKTLCLHEENRNVKKNRTPFLAYGSTDRWDEMLDRVGRFKGDAARAKLQRFMTEDASNEIFDDFSTRQLNDTRYASRLAMDYLGMLYGGRSDANHTLRIQATTGGLTAHLRRGLQLEGLLSDTGNPFKNRSDHRHHAVDAVVIALIDPGMVQGMARQAEKGWQRGERRSLTPVQEPWPGFMADVRATIEGIVVSHRSNGRLAGALHEETNYSKERNAGDGHRRTIRKPLAAMSESEIERITDPPLRSLIKRELESRGVPPKKAFAETAPPVVVTGRDGRPRTIRRVKITSSASVAMIGPEHARRWVKPGSNHHMAIHEVQTGNGPKWEGTVVTLLEATDRRRRGLPVIERINDDERRFVCSLRSGDSVLVRLEKEGEVPCTVNTVSGSQIELTRHADARMKTEIRKLGTEGGRLRFGVTALRSAMVCKVDVLPDGQLRTRRD